MSDFYKTPAAKDYSFFVKALQEERKLTKEQIDVRTCQRYEAMGFGQYCPACAGKAHPVL